MSSPTTTHSAPCVASQLTIVITTSPVQSNPSTWLMDSVIQSFSLARGLTKCKKVLICDGMKITEGKANWKGGRATQQAYDNYQGYIKNLQLLAKEGRGEWANTTVVPLPFRHGFAMGALEGLKLVDTPYVMVVQHDRAFNKIIEVDTLLKDMKFHHSIWVDYVKDLLKATGIADLKWDESLGQYQHLPTEQGMPTTWLALNPNPQRELATQNNHQGNTTDLPAQAPDNVQPEAEKETTPQPCNLDLNQNQHVSHLKPPRTQYFPALPIEEQIKAALDVDPQYIVGKEEFTLNHLYSGYTPPFPIPYPQPSTYQPLMTECSEQVAQVTEKYNSINTPFSQDQSNTSNASIDINTSATVCAHFLNRSIPENADISQFSKGKNQITAQHWRKPQYPHPLPIHYCNFVTNQTQTYLSHQSRDFHHTSLGALPAYHTSNRLNAMLDDEQVQSELIAPIFDYYDAYSAQVSDSDSGSDSNDSSESGDSDNETDGKDPKLDSSTPQNDPDCFQTQEELLAASNQHLERCGIDLDSQTYHFAPRFLPMAYWYDSTHIALTQWYKELYLSEDIGGYPFLTPGCFHEDRYIQFQSALLNFGYYEELNQIQAAPNSTNSPPTEPVSIHDMGYQYIRDKMGLKGSGRPDPTTLQIANKQCLPLPIDPADTFSWTPRQSTEPFLYGAPPMHRVKCLQQTAYRIALCGKVRSFADAHNLILRQMGMWLYEPSPVSYSNIGDAVQDVKTHQRTCLKHRHNTEQINNRLAKYRSLQQQNPAFKFRAEFVKEVRKSTIAKLHRRQMVCGHLLTPVLIEKKGFQTAPQIGVKLVQVGKEAETPTDNNDKDINYRRQRQDQLQQQLFDDCVIVWGVKGDFLDGKTVQHLDGKAFLRYEQKIAKQFESQ